MKEELKHFDFNKSEYEYFIENCCFTERQLKIIEFKRKGYSNVEISMKLFIGTATVSRELARIKKKMLKLIDGLDD